MHAPGFWWREPGLVSALLSPVAWMYGAVAGARMRRKGVRAKVPVICAGNPTVGGAGKTPAALALASLLHETGEKPFFITRGYGGRLPGPLRVDGSRHDAREVGDEPLLLARAFPTIVARDRAAGAMFAEQAGASVLVLDDGFQNPSLEKDLSLLVIDGSRGIGNGYVLPAGPLRAPLDVQLPRAHGVIVVGEGPGAEQAARIASISLPLFHAKLVADETAPALKSKKILAFAGIGNPEKFFASLRETGAEIAQTRAFGDHHYYSEAEARELLSTAQSRGLTLVTTEKDLARMSGDASLKALAAAARVLPVKLQFSETGRMKTLLQDALTRARSRIRS